MNTLTVIDREVQIKEWDAKRVVTFHDIDTVHQRPEGTARKRFNDNRQHFIEGEDYYEIQPSEIRTLGIERPQGGMPAQLKLITESGYLMLVKSFTDDLAWQVQRVLVNSYFRVMAHTKPRRIRSKPEDVVARQQLRIAHAFSEVTGVPLGIATATALDIIEERTGLDYSHWKRALPARTEDTQIAHLNATQLGSLLSKSAQDANKLLESAGWQTHEGKNWRLTEDGKAHGEEYPYKRNGHSDYRILWRDSAAEALREVALSCER
jgi:hypothetical protein